MRVLLLGARGMLGSKVEAVRPAGVELIPLDREDLDLTDREAVESRLGETRPSLVLHCAAYTDVDGAESAEGSELAYRVNGIGARHVAICCEEVGAHLLHLSTDYVFDGEGPEPYAELAPPNPRSVYGKSKLLGEWHIQQVCRRFAIVRTAWLFGPGGHNFIIAILNRARRGESLSVVTDQIGTPTYSRHLAPALRQLAEGQHAGIFHATGGGRCSWFDLAEKVLELAGLRHVPLEVTSTAALGRPAPRPAFSALASYHLQAVGVGPLPAWEEGVAAYLGEIE